jgi:hypothetical protein
VVFGFVDDWLLRVDSLLAAGSLPGVASLRHSLQLQLEISECSLELWDSLGDHDSLCGACPWVDPPPCPPPPCAAFQSLNSMMLRFVRLASVFSRSSDPSFNFKLERCSFALFLSTSGHFANSFMT